MPPTHLQCWATPQPYTLNPQQQVLASSALESLALAGKFTARCTYQSRTCTL